MRSARKVERNGQVYMVDLDHTTRMVLGARLYIAAHDKKPTWRRVRNVRTLEILSEMIFGKTCPCCGSELHPPVG